MKSSIIAMSVAALLAFGTASAAAPTAAAATPTAKPATPATPAATPAAAPKAKTAQQQKMGDCAKANKGKKGDDYKKSMSECLKKDSAAPAAPAAPAAAIPAVAAPAMAAAAAPAAPMTQQERMKSCNADAAKQNLKGDARKTFMSGCLKKK